MISFSPAMGVQFVAVIAGVLAVLVWLFYRSEARDHRRLVRWVLTLLRATAVVLIACLFLQPHWVTTSETRRRGHVTLLVDRSLSMGRTDGKIGSSRARRLLARLHLLTPRARDRNLDKALARFASVSRWERVEELVLGEQGLLAALIESHSVDILTFGDRVERVSISEPSEASATPGGLPTTFGRDADLPETDVVAALKAVQDGMDGRDSQERPSALILIGDGRQTGSTEELEAVARELGTRGIRVYTVAVGSSYEPADLALVDVRLPDTAVFEDKTKGALVVKTRFDSTVDFRARLIEKSNSADDVEREIWSGSFHVEGTRDARLQEFPFEIPPRTLGLGRVELVVDIPPLPIEVTSANNRLNRLVNVTRRQMEVLVVDGRSRWETRYLRDLATRDETLSLNVVVDGVGEEFPRGEGFGSFPLTRDRLFRFETVILGDLAARRLRNEELEWLVDLVGNRGGALVLVPGKRGHLWQYAETPLGPLLPVERAPLPPGSRGPFELRLTAAGEAEEALRLSSDPRENAAVWPNLRPVLWVQPATARAGSETWAVATTRSLTTLRDGADRERAGVPAIVTRRYGLGRVLYIGTDETWRWRYRVGDRYHYRFWTQLLDALRPETFTTGSKQLAIETDRPMYQVSESAHVTVRLRRPAGDPWLGARVSAVLAQGGSPLVRVPLQEEGDGVYSGATSPLEAGRYDVRAEVDGLRREAAEVVLPILVERPFVREELHGSWDEGLLARIAELSGGRALREESIDELVEILAPLSEVDVDHERTNLATSAWWFVLVALLFTAEWMLRKRVGLV